MNEASHPSSLGLAGQMAKVFIDSKLTPLIVVASVLLGLAAIVLLPREEEPQIQVPMIDVMVEMPGASAQEMEDRATRPMEQLLWEIPKVEYVYSITRPGSALVVVRFEVGEDVERSVVRLRQKLDGNVDRIPHGVSIPLVKARSIDDVPILALTFHGEEEDHLDLRRLASEFESEVKQIPSVAETQLIGGLRRQIRGELDPARLAARDLSVAGIVPLITRQNRQFRAGELTAQNLSITVDTGGFLESAEAVGDLVVGMHAGRPVHLREVADVVDGAEDPTQYVFFGYGAAARDRAAERPAVTLTIAKRPGTNAVAVADAVLAKVERLKPHLLPADVELTVTRHYGETAAEKSNELLFHMAIAVVSVSLLILFTLGARESGIVAVAIPSTLALTLLVFYLYGFTLNRITLFALIFSIGILVDDAIVVVENIVRHLHLSENRGRSFAAAAVEAVDEVGNPTILATFTVIAAVVPMAFVGGLMGPYMRPIPIGASAAMFFSLLIAFIVTPWAAMRLLGRPRGGHGHGHEKGREDLLTRSYRATMAPLIGGAVPRWSFLVGITALLAGSLALVGVGFVKVKMLPFDDKSELQVIVNAPEGSSLEHTARIAKDLARTLRDEPEVRDYQIHVGTSAPFNFNGLVRHYFLRRGAHVADIQVNLVEKHHRSAKSHDIAKRIRTAIAPVVERYGVRVAVAEVPPGPPVLQTLVAEIYAPTEEARRSLAREVKDIFEKTPGVVDVDWYFESDAPRSRFVVDKEKAALHGIAVQTIARTLEIAVGGASVDLVHLPHEKEDVELRVELPRRLRTLPADLLGLKMRSGDANALPEPRPGDAANPPLVALGELVRIERDVDDKTIHHKNLLPVLYVVADVAGVVESPVYAIFAMNRELSKLDARRFGGRSEGLSILNASGPTDDLDPAVKWDGEWQITIEVFRDLGLAFAAVLALIYVLMVGWFGSFLTPIIVMAAIPFSLVGILPAHGLMGVFFSATSMIGFMAGAGIVVRNSIILVDFIELRLREGMPLEQAVADAGAVRFRPMMLTALAVVVGAGVILFDPIFEGLAVALIFGEIASLFISRMAVPVLYHLAYRKTPLA